MATRKSTVEWDRIEAEYLAGDDSIREIADRHEISDTAIRKRAKKEKWVRAVRTPKHRELRRQPPAPPAAVPESAPDPADLADDARKLIRRMLDELGGVTSCRGELEEMIFEAAEGDEGDSRRDAMLKAVDLPARAATLRTLAVALKALNDTAAPQKGKKEIAQEEAAEAATSFRRLGPPTLKSVK